MYTSATEPHPEERSGTYVSNYRNVPSVEVNVAEVDGAQIPQMVRVQLHQRPERAELEGLGRQLDVDIEVEHILAPAR